MPVLAPYLIGVVTAPLVVKIVKPIVRGTVKATVGLALEVKRAAAEAGEEFQDIAAEVSSDKAAEAVYASAVAAKTDRSRGLLLAGRRTDEIAGSPTPLSCPQSLLDRVTPRTMPRCGTHLRANRAWSWSA